MTVVLNKRIHHRDKHMKGVAIAGIILGVFGLWGALGLVIEGDIDGWYALGVYAFFLFESVMFKNSLK